MLSEKSINCFTVGNHCFVVVLLGSYCSSNKKRHLALGCVGKSEFIVRVLVEEFYTVSSLNTESYKIR